MSEAEYDCINRAGTTSVYFWGPEDICRHASGGKEVGFNGDSP
jgi:hypothetical protein